MSQDVKLLPLPEPKVQHDALGGLYLPLEVSDYARANMEPLIAENKRLRGEAARLRRSLNEAIIHGNRQSARAERLAEALREAADDLERGIDARIVVAQLRAALDQEGGNG